MQDEYSLAILGFDIVEEEPSTIYYLLSCSSPDFGMRMTYHIGLVSRPALTREMYIF